MIKLKKLVSICLIGTLLGTALTGCGKKSSETGNAGDSNEVVNITIAARHDIGNGQKAYADMKLFKEIGEKTKVNVTWNEIASSGWDEKKNLMFATGDIPDAFYGEGIDDTDILGNVESLVPLNDLIDKYAPEIVALFEKRPDLKSTVTAADGNIYSLFRVRETYFPATRDAMGINKKWLDKLGLEVPTTTDELYTVLKAFKDKDPNGNGKADEIPLIAMYKRGSGSVRNESDFFAPFGVYDNTSNSILTYHLMTRDGKVVFTPADEGYKEALKWMNKLYAEGLIDKELFTHTSDTYYAKSRSTDDLVGVVVDWTVPSAVGADRASDFVALPPLKGPNGDQGWTVVSGSQVARNMFEITTKNKYPEATMKWVNEFYSAENSLQSFLGPIGEMFEKDSSGKMIPMVDKLPDGMSWGSWKWGNTSADSGAYAALKEYESMVEQTPEQSQRFAAEEVVQPYLQKDPYPNIFFSNDDTEALKKIIPEINSYVEMMEAKFVTEGNIDAQWDAYVEQLNKMKLGDAMEIWQKAYDNFMKNQK